MNKLTLTALLAVFLCSASTTAFAQSEPDPFAAYEGGQTAPVAAQAAPSTAPAAPAQTPQQQQVQAVKQATNAPDGKEIISGNSTTKKSALVVEEVVPINRLLERNHFSVNLASALSYDGNFDEVLGGAKASSSDLNVLLLLGIGYTVWDNVTVELSGGTLWRRNAKSQLEFGTEHDWIFLARGWYSYPIGARTALLGGLGLGGYFGSSKVNAQVTTATAAPLLLNTTTSGFLGKLNGGLAYVFGEAWQFRMLLDFSWMIGKEKVTNQTETLTDNATHIGFELGLNYTF